MLTGPASFSGCGLLRLLEILVPLPQVEQATPTPLFSTEVGRVYLRVR